MGYCKKKEKTLVVSMDGIRLKILLTNGSEKIRVGIKPEGKVIARENTKIFSIDDKR